MTVYIDDMNRPYGRMIMCHMIADSTTELLQMAAYVGLKPEWIQKAGTRHEHFDISRGAKLRAIARGAKPVTQRELGRMLLNRQPNHCVYCDNLQLSDDDLSLCDDSDLCCPRCGSFDGIVQTWDH